MSPTFETLNRSLETVKTIPVLCVFVIGKERKKGVRRSTYNRWTIIERLGLK